MATRKKNTPLRRYLSKPVFHCSIEINDSAWIKAIKYDPNTQVLEAFLRNGNRYRYRKVTPLIFSKVVTAKSSGKAFNKYIRPHAFVELPAK